MTPKRRRARRELLAVAATLVFAGALPATGRAADPPAGSASPGGPDLAAGAALAEARCDACHGADGGAAGFPEFSKLAAQLPGYLELQLRNYATGEREHPVMSAQMEGLDETDLSAHYAALPPVPGRSAADPQVLALGERIFRDGLAYKGVAACAWCHDDAGQGVEPVFARIGAQHPDYLVTMMTLFKEHEPFDNPYAYVMKAVVGNLHEDEIRAVAEYASTLGR